MNSLDDMEPIWMLRARREIGVKEMPGLKDHPRIVEYLAATRIGPRFHHDETPWCAAFVSWVLEGSGINSTKSAAARSYLKWGQELSTPRRGAVVVFSRPTADNPGSGHVAFYVGEEDGNVLALGGNQRNAVSVWPYPKSRVLSYRWPDM